MLPANLHVSVMLVRVLATFAEARGIARARLLAGLSVVAEQLEHPWSVVALDDWHAIVSRAYEQMGDPGLALALGQEARVDVAPFVTQLALASGTARDAIHVLQRYSPLIGNALSFALVEQGPVAYLAHQTIAPHPACPLFAPELTLSLLYRIAQNFLWGPEAGVSEVWFTHPQPDHVASYKSIFKCRVRFERPRNALVLAKNLLDRAQPMSDYVLRGTLQDGADALISTRGQMAIRDQIRSVLRHAHDVRNTDIECIAKVLNVPMRVVERTLAESNQTLSDVRQQVLCQIACELLSNSDVTLKDVTIRLGFSEPSAFHRAFKRWTGSTPADFRAASRRSMQSFDR